MSTLDRNAEHEWHVAINAFTMASKDSWRKWMYEAKTLAQEVPRLIVLFRMERTGQLPAVHQQCSRSPAEPIAENHLTCCLGVRCSACPELLAIGQAKMTDEQRDEAKAWTCAAHIAMNGGDVAGEGYLLRVDDRMFWDRVYDSLSRGDDHS